MEGWSQALNLAAYHVTWHVASKWKKKRKAEKEGMDRERAIPHKTITVFSSNRSYHLHDNSRNGNMEIY